jgi:type IV pilus assembly protein PilX
MKYQRPALSSPAAQQRGMSLITTLLFMVAALMLGVSVLSVNVMQERTIGNTKDRDLALQAAEAALRDAEIDLAARAGTLTFSEDCALGLCVPPAQRVTSPVSRSIEQDVDWSWPSGATIATIHANRKYRVYGQFTGGAKFPGIKDTDDAQPRYVIEKVGNLGAPVGEGMGLGKAAANPTGTGYRITARAVGSRPETLVILQSMYTVR